jgi:hypothetical protein
MIEATTSNVLAAGALGEAPSHELGFSEPQLYRLLSSAEFDLFRSWMMTEPVIIDQDAVRIFRCEDVLQFLQGLPAR